jgi:hypothetical protein
VFGLADVGHQPRLQSTTLVPEQVL